MSEHHSSDSDDELLENVDGDVLLGLPDGVVTEAVDLTNPTISRLGGAPKKDGSIRAFRSLRRNKEYALELKIQQATAIKSLRISEELAKNQKSLSANPFSRSAIPPVTGGSQPFGPGNIFQSSAVPTALTGQTKGDIESALFPIRSTTPALPEFDDMGDLVTTLASTKLFNKRNSLSWPTSPAYTPIYISTSSEYIVPEPKPHTEPSATPPESAADNWTPEAYESTAGDVIFQRFARRVSNEAQQCVRYELSGVPLPFQADSVYERLFPGIEKDSTAMSPGTATGPASERRYDPQSIPACPFCGCPRVFECQLMPNILNVLKSCHTSAGTKERVQPSRAGRAMHEDVMPGMEWGTCMVFSCRDDCRIEDHHNRKEVDECWREEVVLVQWE
ncbi:hypothetical protein FRB98_009442 [Tulasnella sp. 332]|nr:hypothetical protein FRB98_009442 [Tulasnella sp. 332]